MSIAPRTRCTPALRRLGLPALAAGLAGLAAALPSAAAGQTATEQSSAPDISAHVEVSLIAPQQLQELLAQIPVGGSALPPSELEVPQLAKVIAELPGIDQLPSIGVLGGTAGVEAALREALDKLLAHEISLGELLAPQTIGGELLAALEQSTHAPVKELIGSVLDSSPTKVFEEGLGSAGLSELLSRLLAGSEDADALLARLVEGLKPETLQSVLGTIPGGLPAQSLDLGELAGSLGKTPEALAGALGQTIATLPETAGGVTRALANGDELAVLKGTESLAAGLVAKGAESTEGLGASGGGTSIGERSAAGASGGPGGAGGSPGTTTVVLSVPPAASPAGAAAAGAVKIVGHSVHGANVTLVVQVPSAGRLTVSGAGFKKVTQQTAKAERVTVHTTLTRSRAASLRKHHRKQKIKLTSSFAPVSGHASSAAITVAVS